MIHPLSFTTRNYKFMSSPLQSFNGQWKKTLLPDSTRFYFRFSSLYQHWLIILAIMSLGGLKNLSNIGAFSWSPFKWGGGNLPASSLTSEIGSKEHWFSWLESCHYCQTIMSTFFNVFLIILITEQTEIRLFHAIVLRSAIPVSHKMIHNHKISWRRSCPNPVAL